MVEQTITKIFKRLRTWGSEIVVLNSNYLSSNLADVQITFGNVFLKKKRKNKTLSKLTHYVISFKAVVTFHKKKNNNYLN